MSNITDFSSPGRSYLDRFRQPVRAGDKVIYRPPLDLVFTVVDVRPLLQADAPPGVVQAILKAEIPVLIQRQIPQGEHILVQKATFGAPKQDPEPVPPAPPELVS